MGDANNTHSIADYLAQLLKDKKQLAAFPSVFIHVERLLDEGKTFFLTFVLLQMHLLRCECVFDDEGHNFEGKPDFNRPLIPGCPSFFTLTLASIIDLDFVRF